MVFFDFFQNRILTVGPWQMGIVFLRSRNHASAMVGHASAMVGPGPAKTILTSRTQKVLCRPATEVLCRPGLIHPKNS